MASSREDAVEAITDDHRANQEKETVSERETKAGDSEEKGLFARVKDRLVGENGTTEEKDSSLSDARAKAEETVAEIDRAAAIRSEGGSGQLRELAAPKEGAKLEGEGVSSPHKKKPGGFLEKVGDGVLSFVGLGSPHHKEHPKEGESGGIKGVQDSPKTFAELSTSHEPDAAPREEVSAAHIKESPKEGESGAIKGVEDSPKTFAELSSSHKPEAAPREEDSLEKVGDGVLSLVGLGSSHTKEPRKEGEIGEIKGGEDSPETFAEMSSSHTSDAAPREEGSLKKVGDGVLSLVGLGSSHTKEPPKEGESGEIKGVEDSPKTFAELSSSHTSDAVPREEGSLKKLGDGVLSLVGLGSSHSKEPPKEAETGEINRVEDSPKTFAETSSSDKSDAAPTEEGTLEKVGDGVLSVVGLGSSHTKEPPKETESGEIRGVEDSPKTFTELSSSHKSDAAPREEGTLEKVGDGVLSMVGLGSPHTKEGESGETKGVEDSPKNFAELSTSDEPDATPREEGTLEKVGDGVLSAVGLGSSHTNEPPKEGESGELKGVEDSPKTFAELSTSHKSDAAPREEGTLEKVGDGVLSVVGLGSSHTNETPKEGESGEIKGVEDSPNSFAEMSSSPKSDAAPREEGTLEKVGDGVLSAVGLGSSHTKEPPKEGESGEMKGDEDSPKTFAETSSSDKSDAAPREEGTLEKVGDGVLSAVGLGSSHTKESPNEGGTGDIKGVEDSPKSFAELSSIHKSDAVPREEGTLEKVGDGVLSAVGLGSSHTKESPKEEESGEIKGVEDSSNNFAEFSSSHKSDAVPREEGTLEKVGDGVLSAVGLGSSHTKESPKEEESEIKGVEDSSNNFAEFSSSHKSDAAPREEGTLEKVGDGVLSAVGLGSSHTKESPKEEKSGEIKGVEDSPKSFAEFSSSDKSDVAPREEGTLEKVGDGVLSAVGLGSSHTKESPNEGGTGDIKGVEDSPKSFAELSSSHKSDAVPKEEGTLEKVGDGVLSAVGLGSSHTKEPPKEEESGEIKGVEDSPKSFAELNSSHKSDAAPKEEGTLEKVGDGVLSAVGLGSSHTKEPSNEGESGEIKGVEDSPKTFAEMGSSHKSDAAPREEGTLEKVGDGVLSMVGLGSPHTKEGESGEIKGVEDSPKTFAELSSSHKSYVAPKEEGTLEKVGGGVLSAVGLGSSHTKEPPKEGESGEIKGVEDFPRTFAEESHDKDEPKKEVEELKTEAEEPKEDEDGPATSAAEKEGDKPDSFFGAALKHVFGSGRPQSEEVVSRQEEDSKAASSPKELSVRDKEAETKAETPPSELPISDKGAETKVGSDAEDPPKEVPTMEKVMGESDELKTSAGEVASEKEVHSPVELPRMDKAPSEDDGMRASEPTQTSARESPAKEEESDGLKRHSEENPEGSARAMSEVKEPTPEGEGPVLEKQPSLSLFIPKQEEETSVTEQSTPTMPRGLEETDPSTPRGTPLRQPPEQLKEKTQHDGVTAGVPFGTSRKSQHKPGISKFVSCFKGCVPKKRQAV